MISLRLVMVGLLLAAAASAQSVFFNSTPSGSSMLQWSVAPAAIFGTGGSLEAPLALLGTAETVFVASCTTLAALDGDGAMVWSLVLVLPSPNGHELGCIGSIAAVTNGSVIVSVEQPAGVLFVVVNRSSGSAVVNFTLEGFSSAKCEDPLQGQMLLPPPQGFPSPQAQYGLIYCATEFYALVAIEGATVSVSRRAARLCPLPAWDNYGFQVCSMVRSEVVVPTVSIKYTVFALAESVWPNHAVFWSMELRSAVVGVTVVPSPLQVVFTASRGLHAALILINVSSGRYTCCGATIGSHSPDWTRTVVPTRFGSVLGPSVSVSADTACLHFITGTATCNVVCINMPSGRLLSIHDIPWSGNIVVCPSTATQTVLVGAGRSAKLFSFTGGAALWEVPIQQLTNLSRGAVLEFNGVLALPGAVAALPLCNASLQVSQCDLPITPSPTSDTSSSSSSSGDESAAASNMAATVGAGIGVLFLIGFNRYLEWKYPHARRISLEDDASLKNVQREQ
jgi:hypothetical protein